MADSVLPPSNEAARYAVTPGSVTWRYAGDARAMTSAGAALLLQVAHPTVAGGVREFSDFKGDPWGRLWRTLDYVNLLVYGGPDVAAATGRTMREMHKRIKGVDPQGRRYHALEPEAYAWVHATLAYGIVESHRRFGRPMDPRTIETFWGEWRDLGRLLGIRERDLPPTWAGFRVYVDGLVEERLEDNDVVRDVLFVLTRAGAPPVPWIGDRTWRVATAPVSRAMGLATVALLPAGLRRKLDLELSSGQRAELAALAAASRATTPVLPRSLREMGPAYLRRRRRAIARGGFGAALAAGAPATVPPVARAA